MGREARAAKAGASRRTTIPAAIGTRTVMATRPATLASGTCASFPKPRAISLQGERDEHDGQQGGGHQQSDRIGCASAGPELPLRKDRGNRGHRQRDERDVQRRGEFEDRREPRCHQRHDDVHRQQRPHQLPGPTSKESASSCVDPRPRLKTIRLTLARTAAITSVARSISFDQRPPLPGGGAINETTSSALLHLSVPSGFTATSRRGSRSLRSQHRSCRRPPPLGTG